MAHRTQSGAPATSPGRWVLTVGASDSWATGQSGGAPDSPFHCPVRLLAPVLTSVCAGAYCSAFNVLADDRWRYVAVTPLAHRTVRCYIGQSGEL
jgi:hypothetical protein